MATCPEGDIFSGAGVEPESNPLPELTLDLYNFDSSSAQNCPYVLTSPRSLEACSRLGVKPVDLLPKSLEEFQDEGANKSYEEIAKRYKDSERRRMSLLSKCQSEREYLIWRNAARKRSLSLSPTHKGALSKVKTSKAKPAHLQCEGKDARPSNGTQEVKKSHDAKNNIAEGRPSERVSWHKGAVRKKYPGSWSTPASPHYRGPSSQALFLPITSSLLRAKLQPFPCHKYKLPPKDMKLMEVIVKKYEKENEEEEKKAKAWRSWEQEKQERLHQKESAERDRWRALALKNNPASEKDKLHFPEDFNELPSINKGMTKSFSTLSSPRKYYKIGEDHPEGLLIEANQLPPGDLAKKLQALHLSNNQKDGRLSKRDLTPRRCGEELRERVKLANVYHLDLDQALGCWQDQVQLYQEAANLRATRRVQRGLELRRRYLRHQRLQREAHHSRKMAQLEAEQEAKIQEKMAKIKAKEERSQNFVHEKIQAIQQSRASAQAAADLRDLLKQKLDKESFFKKSQRVEIEARFHKYPCPSPWIEET